MAKPAQEASQEVQAVPEEVDDNLTLFEAYINESSTASEILAMEKTYLKAVREEMLTNKLRFDYATELIKSAVHGDIRKGLVILEDLSIIHPQGNREYFFYLSLGYARLKEYSNALLCLKSFSLTAPENKQLVEWKEYLEARMKREATIGLAVTTGSALLICGIVGLGLSFLRMRR
ncbi:mitochondrial fission 1 protein-like [Bradysia coprophila]|uniref:mitochondrial fission 1 protein-like n=1 Tax=Bradysia coprophila TaxID=38358 RepID=UPI00187DA946|nr:mitochondrial fission 1 protein-like [Bradysia coprophila]